MNPRYLGLVLAFVVQYAVAQNAPIKFGVIPLDDLKMETYPLDPSAAAVVLADYGYAALSYESILGRMKFERHVRIKILRKEGLEWGNAGILLYHAGTTEERITDLKAATYNLENGKIVETKMSKEGIFKEKFNKYFNIQKFTLPNVKEGAVIEYAYTISSPFFANFPNWQFQRTIPTRWSEYWALIPDFFTYQKYMQGYVPVTTYEVAWKSLTNYQAQAHHWISKNVPAFKKEPYMTSEDDFVSKIKFALSHVTFPGHATQEIMGSWKKLNERLLENIGFGGVLKGSGFLKRYEEEVTTGITDQREKIKAIHNYVKNTIEWDGTKDIYPGDLKKVLEQKKGTAGDINFMLGSMLKKAGFHVDMVLLSTRDHGVVRKEYPMHTQFNYVVCAVYVNNKVILLDATEKYLPLDILPDRCLNGQGLIISKINHGWIDLETKFKSKTIITTDLSLTHEGMLKGRVDYIRDGYDAFTMRKNLFKQGEEMYKEQLYDGKPWEVSSCRFENMEEIDKPAKEIHEVAISEYATVTNDAIYINPFITAQLKENPFKLQKREYPVDFGVPQEKMYVCKITIPEGYKIDEIPQGEILVLPDNAARFVYNANIIGNTFNISSILQINKSLFIQTEYPNLREFYTQVVAKQREPIVLKKR